MSINFQTRTKRIVDEFEIDIPLYPVNGKLEAQLFGFDCPITDGEVILVGLAILYLASDGARSIVYNREELHPAGIIGAFPR